MLAGLGLLLMALLLVGARLQEPDPFEFDEIVERLRSALETVSPSEG
jgi:hypothetical protein